MAISRQSSLATLFELIRRQARTTRTELARTTGLSKATVSDAIATLIATGFVVEVGKLQPGRGRSQVVLEVQPSNRLVIGVQFVEDGCHAALADLVAGEIVSSERLQIGTSPDDFVLAASHCIEELRQHAEAPVVGVGVGVPGLVDLDGREIVASVPYGWQHVPMAAMLETRVHLPVVVTNRAKAAALGEYWQGNHVFGSDRHHLTYIHVGSGIVAGFVFDGEPFFGSNGAAGELGHVTVLPDGPLCGCGNRGCLYMLASESAILRNVRDRSLLQPSASKMAPASLVTFDALMEAARIDDPVVLDVVRDTAHWLGIAIANLVNVMNPSVVVVGGSVTEFGELLMEPLRTEVHRRALPDILHSVPITASTLGDRAGTLGAAAFFLEQLDINELLDSPASTIVE